MRVAILLILLGLACGAMITIPNGKAMDRRFQREVLVARDVVKACEASGEASGANCSKARLVAKYGPDIPNAELALLETCKARALDASRPSEPFVASCELANKRVSGLEIAAQEVAETPPTPTFEQPLGWRLVILSVATTGITMVVSLWLVSLFRRRNQNDTWPRWVLPKADAGRRGRM